MLPDYYDWPDSMCADDGFGGRVKLRYAQLVRKLQFLGVLATE